MLLADAPAVYVGGNAASAIYVGSTLVWPTDEPLNPNVTLGEADTVDAAFQEWHVYPQGTYVEEHDATYVGGISGTGEVTASVFDHGNNESRRAAIGTAIVDDHCRSSVVARDGERVLASWTNHTNDAVLHLKVGDVLNAASDIDSLCDADDQSVVGNTAVAYTQVHRIDSLSDATDVEYIVFMRITVSSAYTWRFRRFTVNQSTGTVTWGSLTTLFSYSGTQQGYMQSVPAHGAGDQVLRLVAFYNPTATVHKINYFELNLDTGDIVDDDQSTVLANIYAPTGLPIDVTAVTPAISVSNDQRMFALRPGPATPGILWGDFSPTGPKYAGTMKLREMTSPGVWGSDISFGSPGVVIGYQGDKHYHAGGTFPNPCPDDDTIYIARENRGTWTVERWVRSAGTFAKTYIAARPQTEAKFARPEAPLDWAAGGAYEVVVTEVTNYGGDIPVAYTVFDGNHVGITGDTIDLIPFNTVAPSITTDASPATGESVTAAGGTWENTPTLIEYAWARNTVGDVPIDSGGVPELLEAPYGTFAASGGANDSYTLRAGDELQDLYLVERATNSAGANLAYSDPVVTAPPPPAGSLVDTFGTVSTTVLSSHTADTGESWTKRSGSGTQSVIAAGRLRGATTAVASVYVSSWDPSSADYLSLAQLTYPSSSSGVKFGLRGRAAGGTDAGSGVTVAAGDGYFADHDVNNSVFRIYKIVNGVQSANLVSVAATGASTRWAALLAVGTSLKMFVETELATLFTSITADAYTIAVTDTDLTEKGSIATHCTASAYTDTTKVQPSEIQGRKTW